MSIWEKMGKKETDTASPPEEENTAEVLSDEELENDLFPDEGEKDPYTLWCLGMAAPVSAKNESPCSMFDFNGCTPGEYRDQIYQDWGVRTAEALTEKVNELLDQDTGLDDILPILKESPGSMAKKLRQAGLETKQARALSDALPAIIENFKRAELPLPEKTLHAWHIAQAAYLAISGYKSQLLSRKEALALLHRAGLSANSCYKTWEEYACSYLLGRRFWIAMEGGYGEDPVAYDENYRCIQMLLRSKKSYYAAVPFIGGADLKQEGAPEIREIDIRCRKCGHNEKITQYCTINVEKHPDWKQKLLNDEMFSFKCPECGTYHEFGYNCTYYDPAAKLTIVQFSRPTEQDITDLNSRIEPGDDPDAIRRITVLSNEMKELIRLRDAGLDDRAVQMAKFLLIGMLQKAGKKLVAAFFTGTSPQKEGVPAGPSKADTEKKEDIIWFEVRLTSGEITQNGINRAAYEKCLQLVKDKAPKEDGLFIRVDLEWARGMMSQGGETAS